MKKLYLLLALLFPSLALAQGGSISSGGIVVLSPLGRPIGGATVTVCAFGASGIPCSPTITVYTDPTLVTPASNPATSDGNGNVFVYANPGSYTYTVTGAGITGKSFTATVSGSGGGNVIASGVNNFTNTNNFAGTTNLNGPYNTTQAGIHSGTEAFTGAVTSCLTNGMYTAGSSCYATINAAITAAGTTGSVLIPLTYAGIDAVTNNSNIPILDLRTGFDGQGAIGPWRSIAPVHPALNLPMGHDLNLSSGGAADITLNQYPAATTTTATLSVGANASVLVGSTANFTSSYAGVVLIVGRETTNEETVAFGSYSIIDATHLSITCAKTHSGTTDIEQFGSLHIGTGFSINLFPTLPSQLSGRSAPVRLVDKTNNIVAYLPGNTADPWPYSAVQWNATLTGANGANKNILIRNNSSFSSVQILNAANTAAIYNFAESANGPILQFANPTSTPFTIDASGTDLTRLTFTGTSGGVLLYGNVGAGNSGLFRFRNNSTDGVDKVQIDTGATAGVKIFGSTSGNSTIIAPATAGGTATLPSSAGTLAYNPPAATGTDLGSTALPWANLWLGTAATNNFKFQPAATAAARVISMPDPLGAVNMPYVIASGTSTMASGSVTAATCATAITTAATNTLTTDSIEWAYATAPTLTTDALLHISPYVTAGNVNFTRCNPTAGAIVGTAIVINWRVIR